jgi:Xaa-Pro aminopeptidase
VSTSTLPETNLRDRPLFGLDERDRRYSAVRDKMRREGISCLIIPHATGDWDNLQPELRYLSCIGGGGTAAALIFPIEGAPIAAVREARRVETWKAAQSWVTDIRSPVALDWSEFFDHGIRDLGLQDQKIGVLGLSSVVREPGGIISFTEFSALKNKLPRANFVDASRLLDSIRKKKSPAEIGMTARAQLCADAMAMALEQAARSGRWLHEVHAEVFSAGIRLGCEMPSMVLLGCSSTMLQTQLLPEFRRVADGDVFLLEAEPKFYGYMAQSVRTVSMRPLSRTEGDVLSTSESCFDQLLAAMRPGESYRKLIEIWKKAARREGLRPGRSMGHGLGLGQDRPWTTPAGLLFDDDLPIEEGDCFVLKPWVQNERETVSGRVGDTVVVGAGGARRLGSANISPVLIRD